jgi:L-ribulose-5-phosphate 4-epimerase
MNQQLARLAADVVRIAQRAHARGLAAGTGGNISARLPGQDRILIKPSGLSLADCTADRLLVLTLQGDVLTGEGRPTKEVNFHLGIYRTRPEVGAVLHCHAPWATAWAITGRQLPLLTPHAEAKLRRVPVIPFAAQGSQDLADRVTTVFGDPDVVAALLEHHGYIVVGADPNAAGNLAELVEETAQIGWLTRWPSRELPDSKT